MKSHSEPRALHNGDHPTGPNLHTWNLSGMDARCRRYDCKAKNIARVGIIESPLAIATASNYENWTLDEDSVLRLL
jgi:hypothetical protein